MQEAARKGTVLVQATEKLYPLNVDADFTVGVVEFASWVESEVVESGKETGFVKGINQEMPQAQSVCIMSWDVQDESVQLAKELAVESKVLVLATRNAHLIPKQLELAKELMSEAENVILLCLRNPYDIEVLPQADVVICTNGDGKPSVQAAIDALFGRFEPNGTFPVPVKFGEGV